jgi:hypothetical protein
MVVMDWMRMTRMNLGTIMTRHELVSVVVEGSLGLTLIWSPLRWIPPGTKETWRMHSTAVAGETAVVDVAMVASMIQHH